VFVDKRKEFNVEAMRKCDDLKELESQNKTTKKKKEKEKEKKEILQREDQPLKKQAKWKQQSEQFRLAMKLGSGTAEENVQMKKQMQEMDSRKECGFCRRKFNEDVFQRH